MAQSARGRYAVGVDFDALLIRFFGTDDFAAMSPERLADGVAALRLQFWLERDAGERLGLWCLMYMLGLAPEVDEAFRDEGDREAAREFAEEAGREIGEASKCEPSVG